MANIKRLDKIGNIWQKKIFSGQITNEAGLDEPLLVQAYPAMTIPHRMWFSWRIFSDPDGNDIKPHYTDEMYVNIRAANISRVLGETTSDWNTADKLRDIVEDNAPIDPDQSAAESADADDVSITGGELMSAIGKRSTMMHRKYRMGLPNHAMLIGSNKVMQHCVGQASTDKSRGIVIPRNVNIEEPYILVMSMGRVDPLDLDAGASEETAILGGTTLSLLYDELIAAIPRNVGTDYTVTGTDVDTNVKDWQREGYSNGDYQNTSFDWPDMHYQVKFTSQTSIYGSKSTTSIYAP